VPFFLIDRHWSLICGNDLVLDRVCQKCGNFPLGLRIGCNYPPSRFRAFPLSSLRAFSRTKLIIRNKYIQVSIFRKLSWIRLSGSYFTTAGFSGCTDRYFHFAAKCVSVLQQLATSFCRKILPVFCRKMNSCFAAIWICILQQNKVGSCGDPEKYLGNAVDRVVPVQSYFFANRLFSNAALWRFTLHAVIASDS